MIPTRIVRSIYKPNVPVHRILMSETCSTVDRGKHTCNHCKFISSPRYVDIYMKIQRRQVSAKRYKLWIKHNNILENGWYCTCKNGSREVGMCAHITSVIWYLSYMRHEKSALKNIPNWADAIQDASRDTVLDESDSDDPEE